MNDKTKKLLGFFVIVLLTLNFTSCTKTKKSFWENGEKKSELCYKGDKLHGTSKWYFENGSLQMESNYENNKLQGKSQRWYFDGQLEREDFYSNNHLNGKSTKWNEKGIKIREENYLNDTLDGEYREYHINGQEKVIGFYNKGLYQNTWTYWNARGLKIGEGKFENGNGILTSWFPNGKVSREINFKNNEKDGVALWYNKNGELVKKYFYSLGELLNVIIVDSIPKEDQN